ncbi:hypothetical protein BRW64_02440 [Mycolicibacterium diernhoferi]|uniref:XRE family transcriptional regulator n=2 Tax=Mycolicibacterium diernhoferi TaxID=1801 RepID=A0A1Q4HLR6_9MYCO|nr:hypothetical protein BRW64_02440 [Mycolicibacterium diernhoferi]OPE55557.1 hypothetical protein BV510_04515 [Mycolicibacterium diernhoferi]PEG52083.1 XRE family transcriptional regulator [Mycolicibacterium diernhoferi]
MVMVDETPAELRVVVGKNLRRLRTDAGITLNRLAVAARHRGLNWAESRAADFERGLGSPSLPTLIALCCALRDVGCQSATIAELIHTDGGEIRVNGGLCLSESAAVSILCEQILPPKSASAAAQPGPRRTSASPPTAQGDFSIPFLRRSEDVPSFILADVLKQLAGRRNLSAQQSVGRLFEAVTPDTVRTVLAQSGAPERKIEKSLNLSYAELAVASAALWGEAFSIHRDKLAGEGANRQKRGQITRRMKEELLQALGEPGAHGR